jgi:hypothetical protein
MAKTININGTQYEAELLVCEACNGKGKVGNPAFDGMSVNECNEEFGGGFIREYMQGYYNVKCCCCNGSGKELYPTTPEGIKAWDEEEDRQLSEEWERAFELRMGC